MAIIGENSIFWGTEIKLNVSVEPIGSVTMDDYEFVIDVFTSASKAISIPKSDAIRIDDSNYVVKIDTTAVGTGRLKCKVTAQVPDADFADFYRTEVVIVDTGIDIIKNI